ncbi:MAG: DoxX family membrane protein [Desulfobacterales bacterium]|nr:DoxX family membrane protein [Desulfobacterales bacterium]
MNNNLKGLLQNDRLVFIIRWCIGFTFIYASFNKIIAPAAFAKIIYGYGLFPNSIINVIAIVLPFLELSTGLSLIFGIYIRAATLIISIMIALFIAILSFNLIRGYEFDCGCFSSIKTSYSRAVLSSIGRDVVILAGALMVLFNGQSGKKHSR